MKDLLDCLSLIATNDLCLPPITSDCPPHQLREMEERRTAAFTAMETGSMQERAAAARSHWSQVKRQVRAG